MRAKTRSKLTRRRGTGFWYSPSTVLTWGVQYRGSKSLACLCARVMVASTTPTANAPQARRRAVFSPTSTASHKIAESIIYRFRRRTIRLCRTRCNPRRKRVNSQEAAHYEALAACPGPLVRRAFESSRNSAADDAASHPPGGGRPNGLVVRLRQRVAHPPH